MAEEPESQGPELSANLLVAWRDDDTRRKEFDSWVLSVADAFETADVTIESAARLVGSTPAEIEAVLHLAMMDEKDLALLAEAPPPKITWFLFSETTRAGVEAGLSALARRQAGESAFEAAHAAIRETVGPDEVERVAVLPPEVFSHCAKKAKQYNKLSGRARVALVDFSKRRRKGDPLSAKQAAWALSMLNTLADTGAISRSSDDNDQEDLRRRPGRTWTSIVD